VYIFKGKKNTLRDW